MAVGGSEETILFSKLWLGKYVVDVNQRNLNTSSGIVVPLCC